MNITSNINSGCADSIIMSVLPKGRPVFNNYEGNSNTLVSRDILFNIFWTCVDRGDKQTLITLGCLNKYHYTIFTEFASQRISLTEFFERLFVRCNKLAVLDREAFQNFSALPILCSNFDWLNHVENNAGGTAFYYEEKTMNELIAWGKQLKVVVDISEEDELEVDRNMPKEEPCISIVTNGILEGTRSHDPFGSVNTIKHLVEDERGCLRLTPRKAVYISLRMLEISKGKKCLFGQNPERTCTYTTAPYDDSDIMWGWFVGFWEPGLLSVGFRSGGANEYFGAAGQKKFGKQSPRNL